MIIKHASEDMKPQLVRLWSLCFGDVEGQGNLFFNKRFKPEHSLVLCENDVAVSMLFMFPIDIKIEGKSFNGNYIYAVATDPAHRGKGYSSQLLKEAHSIMSKNGVDLSLLVPASESLFNYYGERDFINDFYLNISTITPLEDELVQINITSLAKVMQMRNDHFSKHKIFGSWSFDALEYCDLDVAVCGGEVLSFDGGYAVCYPEDEKVIIKEICPSSPSNAVLNSIAKRYDKKTIILRDAPSENPKAYAMSHWISPRPCSLTHNSYLSLVLD